MIKVKKYIVLQYYQSEKQAQNQKQLLETVAGKINVFEEDGE